MSATLANPDGAAFAAGVVVALSAAFITLASLGALAVARRIFGA